MSSLPKSFVENCGALSGITHYHASSVESTQQEALRLWHDTQQECCVSADQQTAGRGRMQRQWQSSAGNVSLSVAVEPRDNLLSCVSFLTSLAVYQTIHALTDAQNKHYHLELKWPNDVLLNTAKCAGILIEYFKQPAPVLIIGVGINVASAPSDAPYAVTSLNGEGIHCTAEDIVKSVVKNILDLRQNLNAFGAENIFSAWQEYAHPIGTKITARTITETIVGLYAGLNADGALLLRQEDGSTKTVLAADCFINAEGLMK